MELFIEKEFLEEFEKYYDESPIKKIVKDIITEYGDKKVYFNYDESQFEDLKEKYEFFALIFNITAPNAIDNIEIEVKKSNFAQTIVFSKNKEPWHREIEKKGALCLSLDNFEGKISELKGNLESLDIDVDEFKGWEMFEFMQKVPFNKITLCDNYILTNMKDGLMDKNITQLLKTLLKGKDDLTIPVKIMTLKFNNIYPYENPQSNHELLELVKNRFNLLNRAFANYRVDLNIMNTKVNKDKVTKKKIYDIHRRELVTNFFIISPGKGFNLVPIQKSSNESITVWTIFSKKGYMRINKRIKFYENHEKNLKKNGNKNFQYYPE